MANRRAFGSYNGDNSPTLRPDSMAPNAAPETTSCFAASGAPCPTEVPLLSGVNPSLQVSHLNLNLAVLHPVVAEPESRRVAGGPSVTGASESLLRPSREA